MQIISLVHCCMLQYHGHYLINQLLLEPSPQVRFIGHFYQGFTNAPISTSHHQVEAVKNTNEMLRFIFKCLKLRSW